MTARAVQQFEVSLKAFIISDTRILLVQESDTGFWELPGGRIDVGEERVDHAAILAREIAEELGPDVRVRIGSEAVTWVRQRPTDGVFGLIVARVCRFEAGEVKLSDEHTAQRWVTRDETAAMPLPPLSDYAHALARLWAMAAR